MTDSTHNTFVTILLILAAIIVIMLLGRWFQTGSLSGRYMQYSYQPASAIEIYREGHMRAPVQSSVTSYSQPTYSYTYGPATTQYQSSTTQSSYGYSCDGNGNCWTY